MRCRHGRYPRFADLRHCTTTLGLAAVDFRPLLVDARDELLGSREPFDYDDSVDRADVRREVEARPLSLRLRNCKSVFLERILFFHGRLSLLGCEFICDLARNACWR